MVSLGTRSLRHPPRAVTVAWSPRGDRLASGGADGAVRLWDPGSGREVGRFDAGGGLVGALAFSADGALLAAAGRAACVVDVATQRQLLALGPRDAQGVSAVAFSPLGDTLAVAWDRRDGGPAVAVHRLDGALLRELAPANGAASLTVSGDGRTLAVGGQSGAISLYDLATGEALQQLQGHGQRSAVRRLCYTPDGLTLCSSGSYDRQVRLWAVDGRRVDDRAARLSWERDGMGGPVALAPDGSAFAASEDRGIRLVDAATGGDLLRVPLVHAGGWEPADVAFSPGGATLAATDGAAIRLFDRRSGEERLASGHTRPVSALAVARRAPGVAPELQAITGTAGERFRRWDARTGRELARFGAASQRVAVSRDGARVARVETGRWGEPTDTVHVEDVATGETLEALLVPRFVFALTFSPDASVLAAANPKGIWLYDVGSGERLDRSRAAVAGWDAALDDADLRIPGPPLLSAGGRRVAAWDKERGVVLAEPASGRSARVAPFDGDPAGAAPVPHALTPGGGTLAISQGALRLLDVDALLTGSTPEAACRLRIAPPSPVTSLAFSADDTRLAAGLADGGTLLLDAATGATLRRLDGHEGSVVAVAFSPDGQVVATAGADTTVLVFELADAP